MQGEGGFSRSSYHFPGCPTTGVRADDSLESPPAAVLFVASERWIEYSYES